MAKRIRIRLIRSVIGVLPNHRRTVRALGLRKIDQVVEHEASPSLLGMARTVSHLVRVEEIE